MKAIAIVVMCLMLSVSVMAEAKKMKCDKKGYASVSCDGIAEAKRSEFCWKGKISDKKKEKICKTEKKEKKRDPHRA